MNGHRRDAVNIHNGIPLSENEKILPFATTWMDLQGIMLGEISRGRQILFSSLYEL